VRTTEPPATLYFRWLYHHAFEVYDIESPLSYTFVCDQMHQITFQATVPHDDNRRLDGLEFRQSFVRLNPQRLYAERTGEPDATLLEVFVALASRASYMDGQALSEREWFWIFVQNLGLNDFHDEACLTRTTGRVRRNLVRFNERRYHRNGRGGLFPLANASEDQRKVELWYQMAAYINEQSE
jgi:hypothetical protein